MASASFLPNSIASFSNPTTSNNIRQGFGIRFPLLSLPFSTRRGAFRVRSEAIQTSPTPDKTSQDDPIQKLLKRDYKWGFISDFESTSIPKGLSEDTVRLISARKGEPDWMLQFRLDAFRRFLKMREPEWSDNRYPPIDFQVRIDR